MPPAPAPAPAPTSVHSDSNSFWPQAVITERQTNCSKDSFTEVFPWHAHRVESLRTAIILRMPLPVSIHLTPCPSAARADSLSCLGLFSLPSLHRTSTGTQIRVEANHLFLRNFSFSHFSSSLLSSVTAVSLWYNIVACPCRCIVRIPSHHTRL